jgi:hypothetical protein
VRRAALAAVLLLAAGACMDAPTTTGPGGCIPLDGAYSLSYSEGSCSRSGSSGERSVVINQTGCDIQAVLPGYALLDGTVSGSTVLFSLTLLAGSNGACGNAHLSGTGQVTSMAGHLTITATYGTSAEAPTGCACLPGPAQAMLTLTQ